MSIGIYIHIPYCIQRCRYCDFTTFEQDKILPPEEYINYLLKEIRLRSSWAPSQKVPSVYFGGGTPSLIDSKHIVAVMRELANAGFELLPDCEVTIEINPATVDERKLEDYLKVQVNRFSVGAQTFNDNLLKLCGRRHSAAETRSTLELLQKHQLDYSFDLLFGLPSQTIAQLEQDLDEVISFSPPHLSAYCLTVPEGHPMATGRAPESEQVDMFELIVKKLQSIQLSRYEISNFSKPGQQSRHNMTYWNDQNYLSFGLSSHSYQSTPTADSPYGVRFWNPKDFPTYFAQLDEALSGPTGLPPGQYEVLKKHEALTDFYHMHLRTMRGLPLHRLEEKFGINPQQLAKSVEPLIKNQWVRLNDKHLALTAEGVTVSNQVFAHLTLAENDLSG